MASGARRAERFCWRERSDKINWRMLKALDLPDVVRRGDPALLEPYALHLTFARLPAAAALPVRDDARAAGDRDAWFVVRVFQLSMEYLLFMRSRDGDVLDSLFQQLQLCEQERDELKARADKWKGRAQSSERQVEKLHQVLQNIAKLLHIHGTSPSAVATIETLLTELVVERRARRQGMKRQLNSTQTNRVDDDASSRSHADGAQLCRMCGKLFSSAVYLEKHVARRHGSKPDANRHPVRSPSPSPVSNSSDNNSDEQSAMQALALQKIVQQFDRMLHSHEENFRMLSAQEANRVQQLYQQFHVKSQLAEELKASRLQGEQELRAQREALDKIVREKSDVSEKLGELRDEIQRLTIHHKQLISAQASAAAPQPVATPVSTIPDEREASGAAANEREEARRLQTTLEEVSQALEYTRVKLSRLQAEHLSAIREKQMLGDRLDQARAKIERLEEEAAAAASQTSASPSVAPVAVSVATKEAGAQTFFLSTADASTQADDTTSSSTAAEQPVELKPITEETGTQIELDHRSENQRLRLDAGVQVSLDSIPNADTPVQDESTAYSGDQAAAESTSTDTHEAVDFRLTTLAAAAAESGGANIPEFIQEISCRELVNAVVARSERASATIAKVMGGSSAGPTSSRDAKSYSSIPRRKFLRSRFQHPETSVKDRIARCLERLDAFAGRFGVSSQHGPMLSDEHLVLVRQALHAHLDVLPTDVLDRMVECEATVNKLIETEWAPRERTRQQALERFKLEARAKSELNQALVKQAMASFAAGSSVKIEDAKQLPPADTSTTKYQVVDDKLQVDATASALTGERSRRLALHESRQADSTRIRADMGGDESVSAIVVSDRGQEQSDRPKDERRPDCEDETNDGRSNTAKTTRYIERDAGDERVQPKPEEIPAPGRSDATITGPRQIHVNASPQNTTTPRNDAQTSLSSRPTPIEREALIAAGATSEQCCEAMDDDVTPALNEANTSHVSDVQDSLAAQTDAAPPAKSLLIVNEASETSSADQLNESCDERDAVDDAVYDPAPSLSLHDSTTFPRSGEASAPSERSMSVVASSELSFAASIPSLESEDHAEREAEASRAGSTQYDEVSALDASDDESQGTSVPAIEEWETIDSRDADDEPTQHRRDSHDSTSSPSSGSDSVTGLEGAASSGSVSRSPPRPPPTADDDIEEIELA